jgi:hypothetical protein
MDIENKLEFLSKGDQDVRDYYIKGKIQDHFEEVKALGYNIVACFLRGSQNYNLDIYNEEYISDIDTVCFILPTFDNFVKNTKLISTTYVRANGEHIEIKDIRLFADLLKKTNPAFVELLFTKYKIINPQYEHYINLLIQDRENIAKLDKNRMIKGIAGIVSQKYHNLCHDAPHSHEVIEKYGYDPKELHHIFRLYYVIQKYLAGNNWEDCINFSDEEREFLINIKLGKEFNKQQAILEAEKLDQTMKTFATDHLFTNTLPDNECSARIDAVITNILKHSIQDEIINKLHITLEVPSSFFGSDCYFNSLKVFKKLGLDSMINFFGIATKLDLPFEKQYKEQCIYDQDYTWSPYGNDSVVLNRYMLIDDSKNVVAALNNLSLDEVAIFSEDK